MEHVIEIKDLKKSFGDKKVLNGISLSIGKGRIFGLLGPNGSGKTTTMRILSCLIEPTSGDITILGRQISTHKEEIRKKIGCVTESPGVYDKLSLLDNLEFFAACYQIPKAKRASRIEYLLRQFDLWDRRNDPAGRLSKGMKQKLSIICAILHDPEILFLDEVTANLDPVSIRKLKDLIREWAASGKTIIFCSHILTEVDELCHEFAIIKGEVIRLTTPQQFREEWTTYNVILDVGSDVQKSEQIIREAKEVEAYKRSENQFHLRVTDPETANPQLIKKLVAADVTVKYITPLSVSLEDSYLSLLDQEKEAI
ncbi:MULTISPECIES: ABC transporter ATP-binding protein [Brevibacillus]|uniref:Multidrug ABC transporter ATP-binding protein n=1 Tax=Brevibacillus parabrevis TaxID=54914 RepID=A0A4Y3PG35_BREPA|nr:MULTISPECIES: ABC transporter ATP-binding protein [Brevibacillus]MBU8712488.1 ABC transporter ATP-binding protein [Brevibacillus parabrevis]RNB95974.1 ABC transporter ATP-binding protein [Brevibacillus parabrevis]UED71774.1 ABC transporter ATP-binding protein [Brevibacillus sp. HD3.3A]GEB32433.1 multidrug ABC transporter ATP-binding protein [Brevibacillus parabrevis]HBZ82355.1 ABC transporter ATP-binding protein [Brevibacillus sp.]